MITKNNSFKSAFSKRFSSRILISGTVIAIFCCSFLFYTPITQGSSNGTSNQSPISGVKTASSSSNDWPFLFGNTNLTNSIETTVVGGNGPIWTYNSSSSSGMVLSAVVANGKVYIASQNVLYCLKASDGTLVWSYKAGNYITSAPAVVSGWVYFGDADQQLYRLYANGTSDWNYTTGEEIDSSPIVVSGYVYFGSVDSQFYCLNAANGNKVWNYTTGSSIYQPPVIANGSVYFVSSDGNLYCCNNDTGNSIWNDSIDANYDSQLAVADGLVYVTSPSGKLYALDAVNGDYEWNYTIGSARSSPAISNGLVYIENNKNQIFCIDASNGGLIWNNTVSIGGFAVSNGMIYGSYNNFFKCANASNGNIIWSYKGNSYFISPAISNGLIYVGDGNGQVLCLPMLFTPRSAPVLQLTPGDKQITLSWQAPSIDGGSPITDYTICRGTSPGNEKDLVTISNVYDYIDAGLSDNTTYYYSIYASNIYGAGVKSSEISVTTATIPSAPQNLTVTAGSLGITLTWQAPQSNGSSPIIYYNIYRGTSAGTEILLITVSNITTYTDSGLTDNTIYYYEVSAVNAVGEGPKSAETNATAPSSSSSNSIPGMSIGEILSIGLVGVIITVIVAKKRMK